MKTTNDPNKQIKSRAVANQPSLAGKKHNGYAPMLCQSNVQMSQPQFFQKKGSQIDKGDNEKEDFKKIIYRLNDVFALEEAIQKGEANRIEHFYSRLKGHDIITDLQMFKLKYNVANQILGNDTAYFTNDIKKLQDMITTKSWAPSKTIEEARDFCKLYQLYEWNNHYVEFCHSLDPFSGTDTEETEQTISSWDSFKNSFNEVFKSSSEQVQIITQKYFDSVNKTDLKSLADSLRQKALIHKRKSQFDKKLDSLTSSEQIKLNPPLKTEKHLGYHKKHHPLFNKGKRDKYEIDDNDITQGQLGNCYYLASIAAIARIKPDYFKAVIKQIGKSYEYRIRFYLKRGSNEGYTEHITTVDNKVPTVFAKPYYAQSGDNELWVILLEKGLAKLFGHYQSTVGGSPAFALSLLTGNNIESIAIKNLQNEKELIEKLNLKISESPIVLSSKAVTNHRDVLPNHSYYLTDLKNGLFGIKEPNRFKDFQRKPFSFIKDNFKYIYIGSITDGN